MLRQIKSYVRREGRITPGQENALKKHWEHWGIEFKPPYDWVTVFGRDAPLVMDIGFGNGESTIALALAHPEWNILGVEVYRPGIGHLFKKIEENNIKNIRVICYDAVEVLYKAIENSSLSRVQVFFPDPWPKKRHHKRRLIQAKLVESIASKLKQGGELALATDWQEYADYMLEVLSASTLKNEHAAFAPRDENRPFTKFERRGEKAGNKAWDLLFRKI